MIEKTEFYQEIEEPIRELVRVLRDNGINTTCSCGHEMYIEADIFPNGDLYTIHRSLFDYLADNNMPINYKINIYLECREGHHRSYAIIRCNIDDKKCTECGQLDKELS